NIICAKKKLTAAIALHPDDYEAIAGRGSVYAKDEKWKFAIADFQKALELQPNMLGAMLGLAHCYQETDKPEEAESYYNKAINVDPDKISGGAAVTRFVARAEFLLKIKKYDAVLKDYDTAIELAGKLPSDSPRETKGIKNFILGLKIQKNHALMKMARYDEAINIFKDLLVELPEAHGVMYNLACAYAKTGENELAYEYLGKAIEFDEKYKEMAMDDEDFEMLYDEDDFLDLTE
ncbi:MAG: tetratricopeptide repeat protein, partial [Chlorobi bacterium]|nr:tetratricopeptide repeat protein [Chlorobiota bacterium]